MDWYKKYIGDYASDTAHLSLLEHGAYNMLLDHYYGTEKPLPIDVARIYRVVRANQPHEKQAVDFVLSEYFTMTSDGYIHSKCEDMIEKYQSTINRNRINGASGGRPKRNPNETQTKPKHNPIQKPETRNQKPEARGGKTTIPKNFSLTKEMIYYAESKGVKNQKVLEDFTEGFIQQCNSKGYKYVDWYATWQTWFRRDLKEGKIIPDEQWT